MVGGGDDELDDGNDRTVMMIEVVTWLDTCKSKCSYYDASYGIQLRERAVYNCKIEASERKVKKYKLHLSEFKGGDKLSNRIQDGCNDTPHFVPWFVSHLWVGKSPTNRAHFSLSLSLSLSRLLTHSYTVSPRTGVVNQVQLLMSQASLLWLAVYA